MGYLTKFGTLWGDIPKTHGRIFFVAPSEANSLSAVSNYVDGRAIGSGNDSNDGLSPERPLQTIDQAVNNATAGAGDIIMLFPGTHLNWPKGTTAVASPAAAVKLNKADLTFVGWNPQMRDPQNYLNNPGNSQATMTQVGAAAGWALSAGNCSFIGIAFLTITAQSLMTVIGAPNTTFLDCSITLAGAANTSTKGIVASGSNNAGLSFINCYCVNNIGAQGPYMDVTGAVQVLIDGCTFLNINANAHAVAVQAGAGTTGLIRRNYMAQVGATGSITSGFDGTGVTAAASVTFSDNRFGVGPGAAGIKNWTGTGGNLVNNYLATTTAGTGSTLLTTST